MKTLKTLQRSIAKWQNKTFGYNTQNVKGVYNHLIKEVFELNDILASLEHHGIIHSIQLKRLKDELADCFIMLVGLADAYKVDLEKAIVEKMIVNKTRKWKDADTDGVFEHRED